MQALVAALDLPEPVDETVNGFVTSGLLELKAVEAAPALERAFAAGRIDETIAGDWEDVQIALGLKTRRETPRKPNPLTSFLPPGWREALAEARGEEGVEEDRPAPEAIRAWNEALRAKKAAARQAKAERREKKKRKRGRGRKKLQ